MTTQPAQTRPTLADQKAIAALVEIEVAMLGSLPTLESLQVEGYSENKRLNAVLDWISGAGRVVTLLIAELIQAFTAIALAVVFITLEAERIQSGVLALGQHTNQAALIAVAFTVANSVLPIYRLRKARGRTSLTREHWTVRGKVMSFWRRLAALPQTYEVDVFDNPTLALTEAAITWATLFLAFYSVLSPLLQAHEDQVWYVAIGAIITQSSLTQMIGLLAGLLLAFGGVFGVQSISHEIGVRTLIDKPKRLLDILEERRLERDAHIASIYERVKAEYTAGKIADAERKAAFQAIHNGEVGTNMPNPLSVTGSNRSANGTH